jgi:AraC-like DNA-binding protein
MTKLTEHRTSGKLSLSDAWNDVPGILTAQFTDAPREWRAALSAALRFPLTISSAVSGSFGTISSVQRGPINMHRLTMKQQAITSKLELEKETSLLILVLIRGTATYTCRNNRQVIRPGDILPIRAWEEFVLEAVDELETIVLELPLWWIYCKGTGPNMVRWLATEHLMISRDFFLAPVLTSSINALLRHNCIGHQLEETSNMVGAIIAHALNAVSTVDTVIPLARSRFSRIYDYITRNIMTEGLSPKFAADELKISVRTLHQACSEKGTTFNKMLADMRLDYASYLLKTSDARISDIAFTTGYGSLPHFSRQFKEKFGISARLYRTSTVDLGRTVN